MKIIYLSAFILFTSCWALIFLNGCNDIKRNDIVTINGTQDTVRCYCRVQWIKGDIARLVCDDQWYEVNVSMLDKCENRTSGKQSNLDKDVIPSEFTKHLIDEVTTEVQEMAFSKDIKEPIE